MKSFAYRPRQQGVALVVALLFLLVVTVISVIAASNSSLGLKMSANMADSYSSFQSAEAGIIAALSLAGTADDPFDGSDTPDPFPAGTFGACSDDTHPLSDLNDQCSVDVDVFITNRSTACPRSVAGSSVGLFDCDYYRIEGEHDVDKKARSKVNLGVVKTIIAGAVNLSSG